MRKFTQEEDQYLRDNYLSIPAKRMSKALDRTEGTARQRMKILGLVVPRDVIAEFVKASRFKKRHKPANKGKKQSEFMVADAIERSAKTRFTAGHLPHNTKADKVVAIRNNKGTLSKWIRLSLGKWEQLHYHNWKKAGKMIPDGFILAFKDKNPLNCDTSNLEVITRAENLARNRQGVFTGEKIRIGWRKRKDKDFARQLASQEREANALKTKEADKARRKMQKEYAVRMRAAQKVNQRIEAAKQHEKSRVTRERDIERKLEIKPVDLTGMQPLRIDHKTVVYIRPGQNPQAIIDKYRNRINNF